MSELRDMSDTNGDGQIDFEEFKALVANLKDYIKLVYEKVASGANDWCCLKDADTGQMMFLNKRSGKTQKSKPKHFKEERIDELKFDHITLDDGTVISTYKDEEGKNMYMDWEAGTWVPLPEQWARMLDATDDIIPDVQNAVVSRRCTACGASVCRLLSLVVTSFHPRCSLRAIISVDVTSIICLLVFFFVFFCSSFWLLVCGGIHLHPPFLLSSFPSSSLLCRPSSLSCR